MNQTLSRVFILCGTFSLLSFFGNAKADGMALHFFKNWDEVGTFDDQNKCAVNEDSPNCTVTAAVKNLWFNFEAKCTGKNSETEECKAFFDATNNTPLETSARTSSYSYCQTYIHPSSFGTWAQTCTQCCLVFRWPDGHTTQTCSPPVCGAWQHAPEIIVRMKN
jgi:hypothetical protein